MINVTTETELRAAITNLESEIIVDNDINITSILNINYTTLIRGSEGVSLFWTNPRAAAPNMIAIGSNGNLTIESLILDAEGRGGRLVQINGGTFTMNANTILRNIYSRSAYNAVKISDINSTVGGTFIMNGGLITGIDSSDAVFNYNGQVFMNNDATITNNNSAGISMSSSIQSQVRPTLTMSGTSTISNNESSQGASAGIMLGADVIMGVNPGDAPSVKNNQSPIYMVGGWYLSTGSTLTMRYNSEISSNYSAAMIGGLGIANDSTLHMYDNATIKDNKSDGYAGGIALSTSTLILEGNSSISNNTCVSNGGGIYMQSGSTLELKGNAVVRNNSARNGAGVFVGSTETSHSTVTIGSDNSAPSIINNIASSYGGGICITSYSIVNLTGQSLINNNAAVNGLGVYKLGDLNLSESLQIRDGLYFNSTEVETLITEELTTLRLGIDSSITVENEKYVFNQVSNIEILADPAYTQNVPVIVGALTDNAIIQLEYSEYVSTNNVPLVIADKGPDYALLTETDRSAWLIPTDFSTGYQVILNDELDQVLIVFAEFNIIYENLFDTTHTNPLEYDISDLPITLTPPSNREGYGFVGWRNEQGEIITQIPTETTGNITLTAVWEELYLHFNCNPGSCCNRLGPIRVEGDRVVIPRVIPYRRCYKFIAWNIPESGSGRVYFPGDTIIVTGESITLYAQWRLVE